VADPALMLEDERIVAIGTRGEMAVAEEAARMGVADRWLIPGLIHVQVHFFRSGGLYPARRHRSAPRRPCAEELARIK
jgi:imidazolonepropionase-like amidohydrolase